MAAERTPRARARVPPLATALGWVALGGLLAMLIAYEHDAPLSEAGFIALRMIVAGALLGVPAYGLSARLPWPHPMHVRFVVLHGLLALGYAFAWLLLNSAIHSAVSSLQLGRVVLGLAIGPGLVRTLLLGVWLYLMIAVASYASRAAEREALQQVAAARTRLAALRAQLHPHFLFNALHTVVQLIPTDPTRAVAAAESLADALREVLADRRDVVTLADEWAFVARYLDLERLRHGDRLSVTSKFAPDALAALLPTFAVQTLVENAVRHALAIRSAPVQIRVDARFDDDVLTVQVRDDGPGAVADRVESSAGTGLRRLRDQLAVLGGARAKLSIVTAPGSGFEATLSIPQHALERHLEESEAESAKLAGGGHA